MTNSATSLKYFPALTGLRAVAAYLVFCHHFDTVTPRNWFYPLLREGHVGVTLFFVLSGFLIAYRYPWLDEKRSFNPFGRREFWQYCVNRIARIWPIYLILTVLTFWYHGTTDLELWITNLTFIRGFSQRLKFTGISAGWSLTVEETFYFLAPFLFLAIRDFSAMLRRERGFTERGAMRFSIVVCAISLLLVGNGLMTVFGKMGWPYFEDHSLLISFTFFGRNFEFLCGYYAVRVLRLNETEEAGRTRTFGVATWSTMAAIVGMMWWLSRLQNSDIYLFGFHHPLGKVILNVLMPPVVAGLIYSLATEKTWLSRFLSTPLMQQLGFASYCFYLLHQQELKIFLQAQLWNNLACVFVALNVISWLCFKLIEEPFNRGIRGMFAKVVGRPACAAAVPLESKPVQTEAAARRAA